MTLLLLAYLGGVLTIVSPCVLPVLPFVFARADRPFVRNGLPMLAGLALAFAGVATLASVAGGWAVQANTAGRIIAMVLLAGFALTLLIPGLADRLSRPLVALGGKLSQDADKKGRDGVWTSVLLGLATGLLWAPCAGPILGLILTGAALNGANVGTAALLLVYALGAATSLALALLVGGRVFAAMKRSLGAVEWVRRGIGVAVLLAVVAIAFGLDTGFLTRVSLAGTTAIEQGLVKALGGDKTEAPQTAMTGPAMSGPAMGGAMTGNAMMSGGAAMSGGSAMTGGAMMAGPSMGGGAGAPMQTLPSLAGATGWLNSPPLTPEALKGRVVLVDFWTYSCINCLRAIPYVRGWAEKYRDQGLVVIGVHTPEFAFEREARNVRKAVGDLAIRYPVAVDSDYAIWRAFGNRYWPAHYFIDAQGRIRHHHFGEGEYDVSEQVIQQLLAEAGRTDAPKGLVSVQATGAQAASDPGAVGSPETYVGYDRAENFISNGGARHDARQVYSMPPPRLNEWGLTGDWTIGAEHATLNAKDGTVVYRFRARDLHLVLGPSATGKPVRFRMTLDGAPPGEHHGSDTNDAGEGVVTGQRLYQLLRQKGTVGDRTFEIRFLDPGVQVYAFTFG